jgi:hypothetical protein
MVIGSVPVMDFSTVIKPEDMSPGSLHQVDVFLKIGKRRITTCIKGKVSDMSCGG